MTIGADLLSGQIHPKTYFYKLYTVSHIKHECTEMQFQKFRDGVKQGRRKLEDYLQRVSHLALLSVFLLDYYLFWVHKSRTMFKGTLIIWLMFVPYMCMATNLFLKKHLEAFKNTVVGIECLFSYEKFVSDLRIQAGTVISQHCLTVVFSVFTRLFVMFTILDLNMWQQIKLKLGFRD